METHLRAIHAIIYQPEQLDMLPIHLMDIWMVCSCALMALLEQ